MDGYDFPAMFDQWMGADWYQEAGPQVRGKVPSGHHGLLFCNMVILWSLPSGTQQHNYGQSPC